MQAQELIQLYIQFFQQKRHQHIQAAPLATDANSSTLFIWCFVQDIPLISNFGSGFWLKPRNMFDRAAFEDIPDKLNRITLLVSWP